MHGRWEPPLSKGCYGGPDSLHSTVRTDYVLICVHNLGFSSKSERPVQRNDNLDNGLKSHKYFSSMIGFGKWEEGLFEHWRFLQSTWHIHNSPKTDYGDGGIWIWSLPLIQWTIEHTIHCGLQSLTFIFGVVSAMLSAQLVWVPSEWLHLYSSPTANTCH